jgi:hypothetical protein
MEPSADFNELRSEDSLLFFISNFCIDEFVNRFHISFIVSFVSFPFLSGALRALGFQGPLPQGIRVEAELQRPRRDQMGALHWTKWAVRNALLKPVWFFLLTATSTQILLLDPSIHVAFARGLLL